MNKEVSGGDIPTECRGEAEEGQKSIGEEEKGKQR